MAENIWCVFGWRVGTDEIALAHLSSKRAKEEALEQGLENLKGERGGEDSDWKMEAIDLLSGVEEAVSKLRKFLTEIGVIEEEMDEMVRMFGKQIDEMIHPGIGPRPSLD